MTHSTRHNETSWYHQVRKFLLDAVKALFTVAILAAVVMMFCSFTIWKDKSAAATMISELENRAFSEIVVIEEPTVAEANAPDILDFGNLGTYSAKAGNCRFTITTPQGTPTVVIENADGYRNATITDADFTRLRTNPATAMCF